MAKFTVRVFRKADLLPPEKVPARPPKVLPLRISQAQPQLTYNPLVYFGDLPDDVAVDRMPVLLVDCTKTTKYEDIVDKVSRLQKISRNFRPVFLVSYTELKAFQDNNCFIEYIPSEKDWRAFSSGTPYDTFFENRKRDVIRHHQILYEVSPEIIEKSANKTQPLWDFIR